MTTLDAAWVEAEAALPDEKGSYWHLDLIRHDEGSYTASAFHYENVTAVSLGYHSEDGPTPVAALQALTAKLRA